MEVSESATRARRIEVGRESPIITMNRILAAALHLMFAIPCVPAQTHTTVRRYKEAVAGQPPEIAQAEDAIEKNDFAAAESLLQKALATDPRNYQAWFYLGFALNGLGRTDDSIHAYQQSVAPNPEVFESNLNLGLMLARENSPEAEQFLRAATRLQPTDHIEEGQA